MLTNEAMLVTLQIRKWTASREDKLLRDYLANDKNISPSFVRVRKELVSRDSLARLRRTSNAARTYHYAHTLPWDDSGRRLLPTKHYDEYTATISKLKGEFESAVREFLSQWPAVRAEAQSALGPAFNDAQYPSEVEMEAQYSFESHVEPVPTSGDFRVALQAKELTRLQKDIEQRVEKQAHGAMQDLYTRLHKVTAHMASTLSDPDAKFKDSLVNNITALTQILPDLNVLHDPNLEQLNEQVKAAIDGVTPDQLRSDPEKRTEVAKKAANLSDRAQTYFGGNR